MAPSFPMVDSIGIPMTTIIGASGLGSMYFLYILQSRKDSSYYIGSTNNLENRLRKHNSGGSRYTKSRTPWKVVYSENFNKLSEARTREFYIKSLKSKRAIEKIIKLGAIV